MSDPVSADLLATAVQSLRNDILPAIDDPIVRLKADHVTRLLWAVTARLDGRDEALRTLLGSLAQLVPLPTVPANGDIDGLVRLRETAEGEIERRLPEWLETARMGDTAAIAALLAAQRAYYVSQDPEVASGSGVVYRGGRVMEERASAAAADRDPVLDEAALTRWLRTQAGHEDARASDIRRIPGGFSKETIFFTLTRADGTTEPLVIRKDLPVPLIEKTVVKEYPLLRALFTAGFPVAEPVWLEPDAALFGGAFLVSRRAGGSSDVAAWSADPARAQAACEELARVLARLHTIDPVSLGIAPDLAGLSAGEHTVREVAAWIDLFHRKRAEPFPLQELPLAWLSANVPQVLFERPARIVHGDIGFHNLMFDEAGQVSAVLDWEFSTLGDPTQDLCFVRQFVAPLTDWDAFVALYVASGGPSPCAEAEFFYDLWTRTRNAVGCVDAQTLFDRHMPGEMRFALAGHVFAPYMFVDQCEVLLGHLAGAAAP